MSDADLKLILVLVFVPVVFGMFSLLFIAGEVSASTEEQLSFTDFFSISWDLLGDYPELVTINIMLISFSVIIGIVLLARYIRGQ